jgi:membrane fusion protein (multidrug efflux system)
VPVEVALSGTAARQVRPGFLARVNIALDPRTGVLMVPAGALLQDPNGSVIYLVQGGKATRRSVRRGVTYQGQVEIVEGIVAGDTVIVAGNTMVREGSAVRIVDDGARDVRAVGADTSGETPAGGDTR